MYCCIVTRLRRHRTRGKVGERLHLSLVAIALEPLFRGCLTTVYTILSSRWIGSASTIRPTLRASGHASLIFPSHHFLLLVQRAVSILDVCNHHNEAGSQIWRLDVELVRNIERFNSRTQAKEWYRLREYREVGQSGTYETFAFYVRETTRIMLDYIKL